jgi:hypothetical protein
VAWKKRVFSVREKCYRKKRCVLFFSFKWRFEWRMTIGEKFQNQGGDRFARNVVHDIAHLPLSKFFYTGILFFMAQRHLIRLSFRCWIRIYQIQKVTVRGRGRNLKFPQSDPNPLFFWYSQYFEDFHPKTWSNSNKKVIFGISSVRAIGICIFQPKTKIVLRFWIAGTLLSNDSLFFIIKNLFGDGC